MEEIELEQADRTPSTSRGVTRYPMVIADPTDIAPKLPAHNTAAIVQSILAQPAPVPQRDPAAIKRERLEGANEKSTPVQRAIASMLRSAKYLILVAVIGIVVYVAIPTVDGVAVTFLTLVAMGCILLIFDTMEYRHSQSGVERLRTEKDHKLETLHEVNRHTETMEAIRGDIEIKLQVLALAGNYSRLADKKAAQ